VILEIILRDYLVDILRSSAWRPCAAHAQSAHRTWEPGPLSEFFPGDGTLVAYQRSGSGAPLVLVHGTGGFSTRWKPILPAAR